MDRKEILKQVNDIFIDVLDEEDIVIQESSTANDVDGWDSLTHIRLIVDIEKRFKIKFTSKEIQSWKNVAEMLDCIEQRIQ